MVVGDLCKTSRELKYSKCKHESTVWTCYGVRCGRGKIIGSLFKTFKFVNEGILVVNSLAY